MSYNTQQNQPSSLHILKCLDVQAKKLEIQGRLNNRTGLAIQHQSARTQRNLQQLEHELSDPGRAVGRSPHSEAHRQRARLQTNPGDNKSDRSRGRPPDERHQGRKYPGPSQTNFEPIPAVYQIAPVQSCSCQAFEGL